MASTRQSRYYRGVRLRSMFALLFTIAACGDESSTVAVSLRTDFAPQIDFDEVLVLLADDAGDSQLVHTATPQDYARGQRVATFESVPNGDYRVRAELRLRGARVGVRTVAFSLARTTNATLVITRSCANLTCPLDVAGSTECAGGRCVPPECSPENPDACTSGCAADGECVGAAACAAGQCTTEGSCIFVPIDGACAASEYCDSARGCLPTPPTDAGTSDAGMSDAGPDAADASIDARDAGPDSGAPNRVFVTSRLYTASFGGVAAADAICAMHASEGGLMGTFIALLGSPAGSAIDRLGAARGWVDLGGRAIADQASDWVDGSMQNPVLRDEQNRMIDDRLVWLGAADFNCSDWTNDLTDTVAINGSASAFRATTVAGCMNEASLVCLEIRATVETRSPVSAGRVAFVSSDWTSGGGVEDADRHCNAEAAAESLPGTYLALLATSDVDASARFALDGAPWVRTDGVQWTESATEIEQDRPFFYSNFLNRGVDGAVLIRPAWYGDGSNHCLDWTSTTTDDFGSWQDSPSAFRGLSTPIITCNGTRALICLQE